MLSKRHRITTEEFPLVSKGKRWAYGPFFVATLNSVGNFSVTKVGVVCSKKVAKTAVLRNTIRRQIYQIAQPFVANSKKPFWCAFFLNKGYSELTDEERSNLISKAFIEVGF